MRARWGIGLIALVGCDGVFNLDPVPPPVDAPNDVVFAACEPLYVTIPDAPAGSQYRFVGTPATWTAAETACEKDRAHLVVFDDETEHAIVDQYLINLIGGYVLHAGYARNLTADPFTGFFAVTGAAVPNTRPPWGGNEPNNGDGSGVTEPVVWFGYQSGLVDGPLDHTVGYLCECDHQPVTKLFDFQ